MTNPWNPDMDRLKKELEQAKARISEVEAERDRAFLNAGKCIADDRETIATLKSRLEECYQANRHAKARTVEPRDTEPPPATSYKQAYADGSSAVWSEVAKLLGCSEDEAPGELEDIWAAKRATPAPEPRSAQGLVPDEVRTYPPCSCTFGNRWICVKHCGGHAIPKPGTARLRGTPGSTEPPSLSTPEPVRCPYCPDGHADPKAESLYPYRCGTCDSEWGPEGGSCINRPEGSAEP